VRGPDDGAASEASIPRTLAGYLPDMIKSVHFTGFRSLKDVELRLGPLTVLVGPNAMGKSTVLRGLEPNFVNQDVAEYWQRDRKHPLLRRIVTDEGEEILTGHRGGDEPWLQPLPKYRRQHLHLDPEALRKPNQVQRLWIRLTA
jgi:hypothetical protein